MCTYGRWPTLHSDPLPGNTGVTDLNTDMGNCLHFCVSLFTHQDPVARIPTGPLSLQALFSSQSPLVLAGRPTLGALLLTGSSGLGRQAVGCSSKLRASGLDFLGDGPSPSRETGRPWSPVLFPAARSLGDRTSPDEQCC